MGETVPEATTYAHAQRGTRGVPKEFVHLHDESSVVITGWDRCDDAFFTLTAQWPATAVEGPCDPRVLAQTVRQSGLLITHAEYSIPLSHQTLLYDFNYTVHPDFRVSPAEPTDLDIEIRTTETRRSGRVISALRMDIHILREGATVARADCEFGWVSPAAYRRLRGEHHTVDWGSWPVPAPVEPHTVGRTDPADVLLAVGDRPGRWQLRNDIGNRLLFDHAVDHVPGLVLIEAAHQAAHAAAAPAHFVPVDLATTYERYVEFDEPCWLETELIPFPASGRLTVRVNGIQGGRRVFRVDLSGVTTR
ncbi:ScbA/BarX family gamma-butyrolactone biosynthesis protein [Streptomyces sp. NPDC090127]|uniref:ScbA/BarX family gamma-butyrolactone biosynthesis protein n=1 Tax=Streptomyces sp. NPDC090127 TaxID=3365953 RepID=UPI003815CFEE